MAKCQLLSAKGWQRTGSLDRINNYGRTYFTDVDGGDVRDPAKAQGT